MGYNGLKYTNNMICGVVASCFGLLIPVAITSLSGDMESL